MARAARSFVIVLLAGFSAAAVSRDTVDRARDLLRSGRHAPAIQLLEPVARLGNVEAQHELGKALVLGPGATGDNFVEGMDWLENAVKGGSIAALDTLGRVLLFGSAGTPGSDPGRGLEMLEKAALRRHGPALESLGEHYARAGPAQAARSCAYFRRAFETDRASGAAGLERCARTGQGMARDPRRALALYSLMRSQGLHHGAEQETLRAETRRETLLAADQDAGRWLAQNTRRRPAWRIPLAPISPDPAALAQRALRKLVHEPIDARTRSAGSMDAIADRHASAALARQGVVLGSEAWSRSSGTLQPRLRAALGEAYRECGRSAGEIVRTRDLAQLLARSLSLFELSDAVSVLESRLGQAAGQVLLEFEIAENRARQRLLEIAADLSLEGLGPDPHARLRALREEGRMPALTQAGYFAAGDFFRLAGAHPAFRFSLGGGAAARDVNALTPEDLVHLDKALPARDLESALRLGTYPPIVSIREAAKSGLEEITLVCNAHGKRLVHDLVEQFAAPRGR